MFIIIVFWLGSDRPLGLLFFRTHLILNFFPYSRLASYLLQFLYLISFLLFPCASVNTRARVPHFL